jgi:hypothetical protein
MQMKLAVTAAEQQCQLTADCIRTDARVLAQTHGAGRSERRSPVAKRRWQPLCASSFFFSSSFFHLRLSLPYYTSLSPFLLPSVVDDGRIERTSEKVHGRKGFDL